jgi:penicillin G amidase
LGSEDAELINFKSGGDMNGNGKIWRDSNGVCHIEAENRSDAYRLMGVAHGRDRGMQVLMMRLLGQGRASEILDASDELLGIDTFFRRMNWYSSMAKEVEKLSPAAIDLMNHYCDGVNWALEKKRPWECRLFGYTPEPWCIEDTILILRMIGYLTLAQSQGEMERLFIEMVQAGLDQAKLDELFPGILGGMDVDLIKEIQLQERIVSPESLWNIAAPLAMASNNWVVSGVKTASGKPILSNDPHLEVNRLPNVWYEMAVKTSQGYSVGANMPGVPALLVGRNDHVAWGATYTFMDGTDSWIEKCRNGHYLRGTDQWIPFGERKEIIRRKKKDPVTVIFYENDHGVLEGDPSQEGYYLTTAWASAFSGGETLNNAMELFQMETVEQGMKFLGKIETSWNWVLADDSGNIGYQMSGLMPKRREGISGFVPLPGWEEKNDWQGFVACEDLPCCYNPDCGYFVTSNQDLNAYGKVDPINMGMGPYRSDRIAKRLAENNRATVDDMAAVHYDFYSNQAALFMEILAPLLPKGGNADILKNWNFEYTADSKGAYLFDQFYKALYRIVFGENGLGVDAVDYLDQKTGMFNDFYVNFDRILLADQSAWFGGRSRETLFEQAAQIALASPAKQWGDDRQVMMKNIVFDGKLPRFLGFDRGPITINGGLATPHQGQMFESAGRQTTFSPSFRMIVDMAENEIHTNMAGGPSDRRFSKWYCSDLKNWETGVYKRVSFDETQEKLPFK